MAHDISEREWLEYVAGAASAEQATRIQRHVDGCPECARLLDDLVNWHDLLSTEGSRLRQALRLPEHEMDAFIDRTVDRIRSAPHPELAASSGRSPAERMFLLRSLIEPIFGSGTAGAAMDLALRRCTTHPEGRLVRDDWPLFVRNLSDTLASICGLAAGRLVNRAGHSLSPEGA